MAKEVYDLKPGRAKRKAERQDKRATKKTNRKAKSTARQNKKATKKATIASSPGNTGLEKRLNYKGAKARAKKADKAAVKKAKSVTPAKRAKNNASATAKHNSRVKAAISKHGGKKKTTTPVKTKRGTGKTYKSAWAGMSAKKKAGFKGGYSEFEKKAKAYNKEKDAYDNAYKNYPY